ncbi:hypothetical protein AGABI2DRAFT_74833 [Agaricus bisporus var. bisporus H97]|uniref:hypothetical protein n=1 Tax=Agaricus bisporus var. bisporus (strain H97 / ATCC MYA-4626 / FGSC 10389) TaxID=936046 RepID=UPI00029F5A0D|nr:hypothetical protein AGABI2DRAFT_74833 [Agaricus bisporus var. bisporus H97]EKV44461.1 hypothetical protein AGABI2DRAFT_74833 [Agaricus bisporus var. bisporus H97]
MKQWTKKQYTEGLTSQLRDLTKPDKGFHFNAGSITAEKMQECTIEKIAQGMETHAPDVWELVGTLLEADPTHARHRERECEHRERERKTHGLSNKQRKRKNISDNDNENDIMMQATNQRCNSMQALVGVFLQSSNVPEQTRNFLSHLGVSISVTTINRAIKTLSREAYREIQRVGATLMTSYAYDNLDVDLVHSTPTVESTTTDTLVHLTTASMFPLHPMTTREDLQFSDYIQELAIDPPLPPTIVELMTSLPPKYNNLDNQGRSIQDRFNSWKFLFDLITYASSTRNPVNPGNFVIPVFGDLLTGQHIHSLQASRINDVSPVKRFQPQIYCHGWFHARMACADAIWRRHIKSTDADKDPTSLIKYVIQIRPLEKHKIHTNPTFRQLHEVIVHIGIVLRLDAWRVEVCRRHPEVSSLEEWVKSNPNWEELVEIAVALTDVFIPTPDMSCDTRKDDSQRDKLFEITRAYHKDFLLYEETIYSMNHGDMGRLDACLTEWIFYFMGCGKTKYAQEILHYLENMYVLYPKPLANAIRMNSLVNPTGRKDHFRGIDWVIEHNNLYIKQIFGGSGSNHTVDRMIAASPLIEVYKDIRGQFEQMFCLTHRTSRHSPPKMKVTFAKLQRYMEKQQANEFIMGRNAEHVLMDTIQVGMTKLMITTEQARAKLIAKREKQEQLRAEAEQSNIGFDNMQRGGRNYERDTEEGQTPIENTEPETIEEPEIVEETETVDDDGSLFVDEIFG